MLGAMPNSHQHTKLLLELIFLPKLWPSHLWRVLSGQCWLLKCNGTTSNFVETNFDLRNTLSYMLRIQHVGTYCFISIKNIKCLSLLIFVTIKFWWNFFRSFCCFGKKLPFMHERTKSLIYFVLWCTVNIIKVLGMNIIYT